MAKVSVDESACVGCGLCANACADVFEMNDSGVAIVKNSNAGNCDLAEIASQCPVSAIIVEE